MLSRKYQFQWIGHAFFSGPRRLNRQNRTIFDNFRPWFVCDVSLSYFLLRRDVTVFDVTSRCLWRHLIVALSNSCWQQSQWQRLFALEKFFGKGRMPGAVIITRSLIVQSHDDRGVTALTIYGTICWSTQPYVINYINTTILLYNCGEMSNTWYGGLLPQDIFLKNSSF